MWFFKILSHWERRAFMFCFGEGIRPPKLPSPHPSPKGRGCLKILSDRACPPLAGLCALGIRGGLSCSASVRELVYPILPKSIMHARSARACTLGCCYPFLLAESTRNQFMQ